MRRDQRGPNVAPSHATRVEERQQAMTHATAWIGATRPILGPPRHLVTSLADHTTLALVGRRLLDRCVTEVREEHQVRDHAPGRQPDTPPDQRRTAAEARVVRIRQRRHLMVRATLRSSRALPGWMIADRASFQRDVVSLTHCLLDTIDDVLHAYGVHADRRRRTVIGVAGLARSRGRDRRRHDLHALLSCSTGSATIAGSVLDRTVRDVAARRARVGLGPLRRLPVAGDAPVETLIDEAATTAAVVGDLLQAGVDAADLHD